MTNLETIQIFDLIRSAYPGIYAKKARDEKAVEEFISLYMENFGGEPFEIVRAAVYDLIKRSKFPPNISEVWEQVQRQQYKPTTAPIDEGDNVIERLKKKYQAEAEEEERRKNETN